MAIPLPDSLRIAALESDLKRMADENARLRKDAERYRFMTGGCPFAETDSAWDAKENLDAAIDARLNGVDELDEFVNNGGKFIRVKFALEEAETEILERDKSISTLESKVEQLRRERDDTREAYMTQTARLLKAEYQLAEIAELKQERDAAIDTLNGLKTEYKAANAEIARLRQLISTNTDRNMTMDHRFFVAEDGFVCDENFDFDAGLKVSGDFVDDEKQRYAQMVACTLNNANAATRRAEEAERVIEKCREAIDGMFGPTNTLREDRWDRLDEALCAIGDWKFRNNEAMSTGARRNDRHHRTTP